LDTVVAVLVAQGRRLFRAGLRALLEAAEGIAVVGEADRGEHAVSETQRLGPDVVVMDAELPGLDAMRAARVILDGGPQRARVLMLVTSADDGAVIAAVRAGVDGVLSRDSEPDELVRAVRVIAGGGALLTPAVTRRLADEIAARRAPIGVPDPLLSDLTEREREVLALVGHGLSNAEIARRLAVSPATVKTHVGRVIAKLDARDRPALVMLAYETGLVRPAARAAPLHARFRDR
jgi:DNA-binding NarL/FixJ family response regulator